METKELLNQRLQNISFHQSKPLSDSQFGSRNSTRAYSKRLQDAFALISTV